jgi:hypothetical protein
MPELPILITFVTFTAAIQLQSVSYKMESLLLELEAVTGEGGVSAAARSEVALLTSMIDYANAALDSGNVEMLWRLMRRALSMQRKVPCLLDFLKLRSTQTTGSTRSLLQTNKGILSCPVALLTGMHLSRMLITTRASLHSNKPLSSNS